ncbi:MAG: LacI family DNA-binding transcriptional regulator, partial [Actinobacteria bacterium]|nr:LacI family DNA-binding transcriptional regulator [Actinomycetota bacterium]
PALIGFDDFDTADVLGVSVVSYSPAELGRRAARLALERLGEPAGFTQQVQLPTWLIERGTGERPGPNS